MNTSFLLNLPVILNELLEVTNMTTQPSMSYLVIYR